VAGVCLAEIVSLRGEWRSSFSGEAETEQSLG